MNNVLNLAPERKWYRCPHCGKKLVIYHVGAACKGVYIRCKECRQIVEIKIGDDAYVSR